MKEYTVSARLMPEGNIRLHGPVFSANIGASGGGVFGKIIFGCHDKLLTNVLYQR